MSSFAARVRAVSDQWTRGRRAAAPAGLIALIAAVAVSGLLASGDDASSARAAAKTIHAKPKYLQPTGALIRQRWLPGPTLTGDDGTVGVPAGTARPPAKPDPVRAAQQTPLIAPYRGSGGTITPAGIATLALSAGCNPQSAVVATAIAMAESGGSPSAQGDVGLMDSVWDWSAGLWQIRGLRAERHTGGLRDSVANQAVGKNAAAMHEISQGCADWTPWSTYNTGAYLPFLSLAGQAVSYVVRWFNAHGHRYPPVPAPDPNATIPSGGGSGGGGADLAAAPAGRSSSRPHPGRGATTRSASAKPGRTNPAAAPSSSRPANGGGAGGGGGGAGGGGVPLPTSSTQPKAPVPLPTISTPKLPLPTITVPKLPLPSTLPSLPPLPKLP